MTKDILFAIWLILLVPWIITFFAWISFILENDLEMAGKSLIALNIFTLMICLVGLTYVLMG